MTPGDGPRRTNGKMDWFFRQWVDGTEIPRYVVKVDVQERRRRTSTSSSGSVAQEGVSDDFRRLPAAVRRVRARAAARPGLGRSSRLHLEKQTGVPTRRATADARLPRASARARIVRPTRLTFDVLESGTRSAAGTLRLPRLEVPLDLPRVLLEVLGVDRRATPRPRAGRTRCAFPRPPSCFSVSRRSSGTVLARTASDGRERRARAGTAW